MNLLTSISAFFAGLLSFLSPCILPLIPAYIALIGGITWDELKSDSTTHRKKLILRTFYFITGFSVVFTVLGILFSGSGMLTTGSTFMILSTIAGIVVILFGINIAFNFIPFLNYEARIHITKPASSPFSALLIGMAFGAGWTPCVGPMLASILLLVSRNQSIVVGTIALLLYSLGLAVPFLLTAFFFEKINHLFKFLLKNMKLIKLLSAVFLIVLGILMLSGSLQKLTVLVMQLSFSLNSFLYTYPVASKLIDSALLLIPVIIVVIKLLTAKTKPTIAQWVILGFFSVLVILELINVFSLSKLIATWLRFQGI
ncbi:MAG TPA: cytochrome c biogenesis protein CcdA [Spirochaetia bacterium]|nr:cytochrome c biogenesis protein CcdA [Spirochaetales bacterium]HRS66046.1 cytochrome c biogenesis protein CcdA [Spirochaetia bacterium]HOT58756.1 cytochrome c biogenesis protein CcdA [Spirochaetales bacterium]HPD80942.1 cytochrome c biogenesis protein CcdA [Spirochaetales bacterium]HQG39447.1 cytochrome c biogenesis protein CcdA [Spirochaetales bacterium]